MGDRNDSREAKSNRSRDRGRGGAKQSTPSGRGGGTGGRAAHQKRKLDLDFTPHNSPELLNFKGEKAELTSLYRSIDSLRKSVDSLHLELAEVKGENVILKQSVNLQQEKIVKLELELDDLQQYGRRENVCFSNLKFNDELPVMKQVVDLCEELNVTVTDTDFVDVHPLPSRNGRAKRVVARFKDRKLAQKVMGARKGSKNIDPNKRDRLAADPNRGFGIQPNITPKRSALLAQAKAASDAAHLDGSWVDIKTGAILLRLTKGDRPRVIRNTQDIVELVPSYVPNEFIFCLKDSDKFAIGVSTNATNMNTENSDQRY